MASDRWTIFARAVGKDGQGIEMKLIDASGDTDLMEVERTARASYGRVFGGEPQQVSAAKLPYWEEADGNEEDET